MREEYHFIFTGRHGLLSGREATLTFYQLYVESCVALTWHCVSTLFLKVLFRSWHLRQPSVWPDPQSGSESV